MTKKKRVFVSQLQKDEIDDVAEREGTAVDRQRELGLMKSKGGKRRKGVKDIADESKEALARALVQSEPHPDHFRRRGY